jgi:predicted O-methyltransferase YrrM
MIHYYQTIGENWFTYSDLYKSMIDRYGNGSHFVEVGSWLGRSSCYMGVEIYNSNYDIKFDCVDTWEGSVEHTGLDEIKNGTLYNQFLENIEPIKHIVNPIKTTSVEASKLYADGSLDFVFIDASHEYQDVLDDIMVWLPKVKVGGIIAGHDYEYYQVNNAVHEFFKNEEFVTMNNNCWLYEKTK